MKNILTLFLLILWELPLARAEAIFPSYGDSCFDRNSRLTEPGFRENLSAFLDQTLKSLPYGHAVVGLASTGGSTVRIQPYLPTGLAQALGFASINVVRRHGIIWTATRIVESVDENFRRTRFQFGIFNVLQGTDNNGNQCSIDLMIVPSFLAVELRSFGAGPQIYLKAAGDAADDILSDRAGSLFLNLVDSGSARYIVNFPSRPTASSTFPAGAGAISTNFSNVQAGREYCAMIRPSTADGPARNCVTRGTRFGRIPIFLYGTPTRGLTFAPTPGPTFAPTPSPTPTPAPAVCDPNRIGLDCTQIPVNQ